ncbi:MAG: hypothetical protein RR996_03095 [Alistipes sp.]
MSWNILTPDTLLSRLSGPEHDALNTAALSWAQSDPLPSIAHEVAEEWRGGLRRVTAVDRRIDAIPSELLIHVLADYRYRAFTRLPGLSRLLDDLRVEEWKRALTVRDALAKISYELPETQNLPIEGTIHLPLPAISITHHHTLD